jgi:hypothetical protein
VAQQPGPVPGAGANGNRIWREELFHWDTVSMVAFLLLTFIADDCITVVNNHAAQLMM